MDGELNTVVITELPQQLHWQKGVQLSSAGKS
jgi:hypothetical protein